MSPASPVPAILQAMIAARGRPLHLAAAADLAAVAGAKVLLTGAAGSIGTRLVETLLTDTEVATVVAFDHDDTALQRLRRQIAGPRLVPWLGDVRDQPAVLAALQRHRCSLVVHAAAVKHSDLLEANPREAVRTNVLGTRVVAAAAQRVGARLVNLSTDKAASAANVLGASKHLAERVVAASALASGAPCVSLRLGNVLDSRGSVLEAFLRCVADGEPLPLTDARMTRLWSTMAEVTAFVLRAAHGSGRGEVHAPPLGEPLPVAELARLVAATTGSNTGTRAIGPRPGDAMHEVLIGAHEHAEPGGVFGGARIVVKPWCDDAVLASWLEADDAELAAALLATARPVAEAAR